VRGSGWVIPSISALLWLAAVLWPAAALLVEALWRSDDPALVGSPGSGTGAGGSGTTTALAPAGGLAIRHGAWALLARSAGWACAVAALAVVLGWMPGRVLGGALLRRAYLPVAALFATPMCLPAYVIFYLWWQSWPADSALHAWAIQTGSLRLFKHLTLLAGLASWSWPLVAWCVAAFAAAEPQRREELLRLDGAGGPRLVAERLRGDGRGLALGALLVFLFVLGNTTAFDVAAVYTYGFELRSLDSSGAGPRALVIATAPAAVLCVIGIALVWGLMGGAAPRSQGSPPRLGPPAIVATAAIWALTVLVPMSLFARSLSASASIGDFLSLHARDFLDTLGAAGGSGMLCAAAAVGMGVCWQDHRRWIRAAGTVQALGWLVAALLPGTIVALALEAGYNRPLLALLYSSPTILLLGHSARFAFVGALLGRFLARLEPAALRDLRRLDGAQTLYSWARSSWPRAVAAGGGAFCVASMLSLGDLSVAPRLAPAGTGSLALAVLGAVHYQRPDTVLLASVLLMGLGVVAGTAAAAAWWPLRRFGRGVAFALVAAACTTAAGCGETGGESGAAASRPVLVFGSTGLSPGQFTKPRAIAVDRARGVLYVVDKTARVQRFALDGSVQGSWDMPEWDTGMPTGISVSPEGQVFVADTHYHRVIAYDPQGKELMRFGGYGEGPGQFIYPTDVAFGPQGRLYVSEYGGNDRVQVFSARGEHLFSFGRFGSGPGEFRRPQSLCFSPDLSELYVADACNHRIGVFDAQGELLRSLGGAGREPGRLSYPYGLTVLEDGSLLVAEFAAPRIQRLSRLGECMGVYGRPGGAPGELMTPWGVDAAHGLAYVLDTGNNRVQVIRPPSPGER
jgi:DNA-binding beta-propeller fold protein YncE/ABC-type Fe3+ transport system permease subunit